MRKRPRTRPPGRGGKGGPVAAGTQLEVEVERILPGGLALAHEHGQTVLVALAAPGDRARVRVRTVRGRVAFASIEEVLTPSPSRVEPPCPYFGRCGGCDFQQLTYEAQLSAKAEIIRDCLRRVARVEWPHDIPVTPSPDAWRYRSRAQWQHDRAARALGYFERGTHKVCDVAECPVVDAPLQATLDALRAAARDDSLPESVFEFEAVAGDEGVALSPPLVEGHTREQTRTVGGERYRFDAACFFQINHALLEPLVREAVQDARGDFALDLYCGVGLFTLPLARRHARVVGVEGNAAAARYARLNLADANLDSARVDASAVGPWLTKHAGELSGVDLILLDPPRTGAEPETVDAILAIRPAHISYVSCDPATLARDLNALHTGGYTLTSVRALDMFPQTHHVETIAHLKLTISDKTQKSLRIYKSP